MFWFYRLISSSRQRVAALELAALLRDRYGADAERQLRRKLADRTLKRGRAEARLALDALRAWRALEEQAKDGEFEGASSSK